MNKTIKIFLLLAVALITFGSCSKTQTNDVLYAEWKSKNEAYFDSCKSSGTYTVLRIPVNQGGGELLYKQLKAGDQTSTPPLFNSTVSVHYKGWGITGVVFDKSFEGDQPSWEDRPSTFSVDGVVRGWTEILQQMYVGEKVEVLIPWKYAYGAAGSSSTIPPYSALHFEIELLSVVKY